jgi:hypothetical protein
MMMRAGKRCAAGLTILIIGGTLPACGIYGPPKRPAPAPETATRLDVSNAEVPVPVPEAIATRG